MITRCKIGKGITGAVRYILGEGRDPDSGELNSLADGEETRVDWFGGVGFGFEVASRDDAEGPSPPQDAGGRGINFVLAE